MPETGNEANAAVNQDEDAWKPGADGTPRMVAVQMPLPAEPEHSHAGGHADRNVEQDVVAGKHDAVCVPAGCTTRMGTARNRLVPSVIVQRVSKRPLMARSHIALCRIFRGVLWALLYGLLSSNF